MEPDCDAQLRTFLDTYARHVPDNATVIPALRQRLTTVPTKRRFTMNGEQQHALPKAGIAMAMALIVAFVLLFTFGPFGQHRLAGSASTPATVIPSATSVPVQVTVSGITIEFDGFDANPVRTAVRYKIVTQPAKAHEDYYPGDMHLSDSQQHVYQLVGGSGYSDSSSPQRSFMEADFVPFAPTLTGSTTLTFQIVNISDVLGGTTSFADQKQITGPWTYTATVTPARSGMQTFTSAGVLSHGIAIKPLAADWISGGDHFSHTGLHVQLGVSGLATNLSGATFFVATKYVNAIGGNGSQIDSPTVVTLITSSNERLAVPAIFKDTLNADNTIGTSGKAVLDIVFQNVVVTHGEDIQLRIENLSTCSAGDCSSGSSPIPGTWSLTLHL